MLFVLNCVKSKNKVAFPTILDEGGLDVNNYFQVSPFWGYLSWAWGRMVIEGGWGMTGIVSLGNGEE